MLRGRVVNNKKIVIRGADVAPGSHVALFSRDKGVYVILLLGDGDPEVSITAYENNSYESLKGNDPAIWVAEGAVRISALNTSTSPKKTPTIEVLSIG